jgi:gas vesicle protein
METPEGLGRTIGALLIGAAVGGALGILFAPDKGSRTRKKLMDKSEDLTDTMKEKFDDLLEEVKDEIEAVKNKVGGHSENGVAKTVKHKAH